MKLLKPSFLTLIALSIYGSLLSQKTEPDVFPGANEKTPSRSQYFSWINNTNEGSTEEQTLKNLAFFKWLNDEYGMKLDIYAYDAGAIDGAGHYGSDNSNRFKSQFPNGFQPMYSLARESGTRLGIWGGPDGFGDTPAEVAARTEMMVALCRDYKFELFKFDAVCGNLRDSKQEAFINMMAECRKYSPDLILLNHRLNLHEEAKKHATTSLMGGAETYIDVHMVNRVTATHHRAGALSRELAPDLMRLSEDHGVCISSCLDYWEDDLILQAFNRNMILAPEIYGNPWLLRDDEFPKLARIYNLTRKYRDILVEGIVLPEEKYGLNAVSRGDERTRLITLRNLGWSPLSFTVKLDEEIGLEKGKQIEVRQYHPTEKVLGVFKKGDYLEVEVLPFRSCLLVASSNGTPGFAIEGTDYEIIQDIPGKPLKIELLGMPGEERKISLKEGKGVFTAAMIDGVEVSEFVNGDVIPLQFEGDKLAHDWHRKLGDMTEKPVPEDAQALYEATCFAADNNALEVRSLLRSGPSSIPQVSDSRDAFFNQELFVDRGLWDRYMFDGKKNTSFYVSRRRGSGDLLINGGSFRLDLGEKVSLDKLVIRVKDEQALQPFKSWEAIRAEVSSNLKDWEQITFLAGLDMEIDLDPNKAIRYMRLQGTPENIYEIEGYRNGKAVERDKWSASHHFSAYRRNPAREAWEYSFMLDEVPSGSYLAIALNGKHGVEGAYAAIRVNGIAIGAPDRSVSYSINQWEYPVRRRDSNYTYYIPLSEEMTGAKIDAVVLTMKDGISEYKPEVWITSYPIPFGKKELLLYSE
ncbi:MAG: hypothetical protein GY790_08395 [Bacteroidetes bacterium]|nr:hypothetical protein [Bacteroidota bacterium]